jgi:hypothetical protein
MNNTTCFVIHTLAVIRKNKEYQTKINMYCSKCGNEILGKDLFCSKCGTKSNLTDDNKTFKDNSPIKSHTPKKETCKKCNKTKRNIFKNNIDTKKSICISCDSKLGFCPICYKELRTKYAQQCQSCHSSWREKSPVPQTSTIGNIKKSNNNKIQCPKCKSINIIGGKKGFSGKQAVGGAILTGGIGILAGTIGSNKVELSCLSCGNKFKPGKDFESVKVKNKQTKQMLSSNGGKIFLGIFLALMIWGMYWLGLPYWSIIIIVVVFLIKILWDANSVK